MCLTYLLLEPAPVPAFNLESAMVGFVCFVALVVSMGLGIYIAQEKGRSAGEGALFGFLLGPLGVLIEACMPTLEIPPARRGSEERRVPPPRDPDEGAREYLAELAGPAESGEKGIVEEFLAELVRGPKRASDPKPTRRPKSSAE
jgi:hypothetical protein